MVGSWPPWVGRAATVVGFVLLVPVGLLYLGSVLIVPAPWVLAVWALWVVLVAGAVAFRRRPGIVLAVPVVAVVLWLAILSAGSALFGWTA